MLPACPDDTYLASKNVLLDGILNQPNIYWRKSHSCHDNCTHDYL